MPRQDKDGAVPGDKRTSNSFAALFGGPVTQGIGSWHWSALRTGLLAEAVDAANAHGDALSFATNRANTAGSITLLTGGDRPRRWVNSYDEAEDFLDALVAEYAARTS